MTPARTKRSWPVGASSAMSCDELLEEAAAHPVVGWDFSWLGGRVVESALPWRFEELLAEQARCCDELLDLGTGGGEFLASLGFRPRRTVATESWRPNVECTGRRLREIGVGVVEVEAAPDNVEQLPGALRGRLHFANGSFGLIADRHESFVPVEVARVLRAGGAFVTQQMGGNGEDLADALALPRPTAPPFTLDTARRQLERAGLEIAAGEACRQSTTFSDVGALAWYLTAVPWTIEGFSIAAHRPQLRRVHERMQSEGPLVATHDAFWVMARTPR